MQETLAGKKKKIMFYIGSLTKGGAQRVMLNLTQALLAKGHGVVLVTTAREEDEYPLPQGAERILSDLTAEELGSTRAVNFMKRFCKLRRIWKMGKPDILISFIGKNNIMAILTSRGLRIPVLVSVRGEPHEEYYNRSLRLCAKYLFPKAAGVILQTEDSKAFFTPEVVKKAVVLPNPLNPVFVEGDDGVSAGKAEPASPTHKNNRKKITLMGRVDVNKNHKLAIDAFRKLSSQFPDYVMEIWGDGEERPGLLKYVEEAGLADRVFLPGTTEEVKEKLQSSCFYILSSNTEGMPNSLMEAMAMGLPVISTDCPCGGPRMLIEDGVNGLLVGVKDVDAMAAAMKRLMEDEAFARVLGKKAAEIREKLNPKAVNDKWEEYILSKCS